MTLDWRRFLAALTVLSVGGSLAFSPTAASAAPPAPFNACSSEDLPLPSASATADTIIVNGQMTQAGQEAYYAAPIASGGLANANTTVAFRSVVNPIPLTGLDGFAGSAYGDASAFSYAGEAPGSTWPTGSGVGSVAGNSQLQYWQSNGYDFYYTVAASDFVANGQPLFVGECAGDGALRLSDDQGLYVHEVVADLAAGDGWNWAQAVEDITPAEWDELDYWVELAKALNKKVVWSEPAQGWEALAQNATAEGYFAQWGNTLVPMFGTDFDTPQTGHLMGLARYWAATVAETYGMPLGESVQSWFFREQPDLAAQIAAGLPTAGATLSGTQSTTAQPPCCELDPLNTNAYWSGGVGYGDPLNDTFSGEEPSLSPTANATQALADYGADEGASYYEVEGTNGLYGVADGIAGEGPVDDMAWTGPGVANASSFMQGIRQFSVELSGGPPARAAIPTKPLYQLWNPDDVSHYYTTQTNNAGAPLKPNGAAAPNCNSDPAPAASVYCYQETADGATPAPAGYVATNDGAGEVALYEYANSKHGYYYTTNQSSAPTGYSLAGNVSGLGAGIVGYVMTAQQPGTEPFYWMDEPGYSGNVDYFYTTNVDERSGALDSFFGYEDLGINSWLFTAPTLSAGAGATLVFQTPPPASVRAGGTFSFVVAEEDADGNVVTSDSSTNLALATDGGGFACTTSPTALSDGTATFSGCSFTTASSGPYTLSASATWLVPASASVAVSAGAGAQLTYQTPPPSSVGAGSTFPVVVEEEDTYGNLVSSDSTTAVTLTADGGGFSCAANPTEVTGGVASFSGCSFTTQAASPYTLTASAPSASLTPATVTTAVSAGAATKLVYQTPPPSSVQAASPFTVIVTEEDADGNVVTSDSTTAVTLTADGGGGFACTTSPPALTDGTATFSGCSFTTASTSPYTLTASAPSASLATSTVSTTVSAGAATKLVYHTPPPASVPAGSAFPVVVYEEDASGNVVSSDSTTALRLAADNGGGGFSCTTSPAVLTDGTATFNGCSFTTASATPYNITASSASLSLTAATATTTVPAGAAVKLVYSMPPPSEVEAGSAFPVTVEEQDAFGNVVALDSSTNLTLAADGGHFSCTTSPAQPTRGVAIFSGCSFTVASPTPYTITASAPSTSMAPAAAPATVSAGAGAKLTYQTAPPTSVQAGSTFSVVIEEQDEYGNVVSSDSTTTLELAADGGGFACTTSPVALTDGIATYSGCSFATASSGPYTLTASTPSNSLTPAAANTTVLPATTSTAAIGMPEIGRASVKGTAAKWIIGCTGTTGARCTITASLSVVETLLGDKLIAVTASAAPKRTRRTVTIGALTITLDAGQNETATIKLGGAGQRLLASHHTLKVRLSASNGKVLLATKTVTFKQPAKKAPKGMS